MSQVQERPAQTGTQQMRAARYHVKGQPFTVDEIDRPPLRPNEVLLQVKACGLVPNFAVVLDPPPLVHSPELPAIYGLDAAGVVVDKGELVYGVNVGDRVYVNPHRSCGSCRRCRMGKARSCDHATLSGYFGTGPKSPEMMSAYRFGGYAEYMPAPQDALVKLPASLDFESACRWGYLGTGYSALRRSGVNMSTTVLINGAGGTLGLGAVIFALALGAPRILAVGKSATRLERVKELAPDRIEIHSAEDESAVEDWAKSLTEGEGADVVIDALPTGCPPEFLLAALRALAPGGIHVNIGGVIDEVPIRLMEVMNKNQSLLGSFWFTTSEGQEMADLAASGRVDLSILEHKVFALEDINDALALAISQERDGGFTNIVISPETQSSLASLR